MKRKTTFLKSLLLAAGLLVGANAWGQITGLPSTYTSSFGDGTIAPFEQTAATVNTVNSTNCGWILRAVAAKNGTATATAYFDSDTSVEGNQEYTLSTDEQITISFTAYHGYYSYSETSKFAVLNSDGVELVSYTYNPNSAKITDVSIGGTTADGFSTDPGFGISYYNASGNANGFTDAKKAYISTAGANPIVTIIISQNGAVSINFNQSLKSVDNTYSKILDGVKMNLDNIILTNSMSGRDNNADRVAGIGNITIRSATIPKANVTFKYYDTNDKSLSELKSDVISSVAVGTNISSLISASLSESFYGTNCRYDYSTYTCSETEVQAEGSTINLKFAPKAKYTYTVTAVDESSNPIGTVMSGVAYEGDGTIVYFPYAAKIDGNWYTTTETNYAVDVTSGSVSVNKTYIPSSTVVGFVEGESGFRSSQNNSYSGGYDGAIGAAVHTTVGYGKSFGIYGPGKYKITAKVTGNAGRAVALRTSTAADYTDPLTSIISEGVQSSSEVTIYEPSQTLYVTGRTADNGRLNQSADFDYVVLERTGDATVPATMGANGYTTFASAYNLDLDNLPDGLTAYTASLAGTKLSFTEKSDAAVAAGTGLLLMGDAGQSYDIPVAATGSAVAGNALTGVTTATELQSNAEGNYIFVMKKAETASDALTFLPLSTSAAVTVPAGKAYVSVPASVFASGAKALTVSFGDVTGIESLKAEKVANGQWFNLAGQRVAQPTKGLYIQNGKKVIVK